MKIGIPREIKTSEFRVGATPYTVRAFVAAGHQVQIETHAGEAIGFSDRAYQEAGATIVGTPQDIYKNELIIKVKEPQASEFPLLHKGQILFCYLHLAPDPEQARELITKEVIGVAYETVTDASGRLPLLVPMSEIAGRIAIQAGATALQMNHGGRGVLLGGIPGVKPGKVVVLGGGVVGTEAMRMALGLGADVTLFDRNLAVLRDLDRLYAPALKTIYSTPAAIEEALIEADLVIGAVLIPGKQAPKLVTRAMLQTMKKGSVIVDVAIDQGGCIETSKPTTHANPTYVVDGVIHYAVTNMPAACARTATIGLTNATLPYALQLANLGYKKAMQVDSHLRMGLNVYRGKVTNPHVAEDLGYTYVSAETVLI
ncbi:MAG: Alanine dehydrogenase [Chlamydiota bacterium]|jgi:alanine dehydrogenase